MISAILIDSREPEWLQQLTFGGIPTSVTMLEHGDVLLAMDSGEMIAIERKSPSDFLNTLRDDRLFPQLTGLRALTPWAYLLICGELSRGADGKVFAEGRMTGWAWAAVQGALLTAQELGVFVTYCGGDTDFEAAVLRLGRRDRTGTLRVMPPRQPSILTAGEAALASLPGIGVEKVASLLDYCGSVAVSLQYLSDPVTGNERVSGIGPVIKANVRKALGLTDGYELCVVQTSDKGENGNGKH